MMKLRRNPRLAFIDGETGEPPKEIVYPTNDINYPNMLNWINAVLKNGEIYGFICKVESENNQAHDHVLIVYKTLQGELRFYDPQNNIDYYRFGFSRIRFFIKRLFHKVENDKPKIFRIDNADLNFNYLDSISQ